MCVRVRARVHPLTSSLVECGNCLSSSGMRAVPPDNMGAGSELCPEVGDDMLRKSNDEDCPPVDGAGAADGYVRRRGGDRDGGEGEGV